MVRKVEKTRGSSPPVLVDEETLRRGAGQENVMLLSGETLTRAKALELYNTAKRKLRSHADLVCVQQAMEKAGIDLAWELTQLKAIASQDKDYKAALQAIGMIRLVAEAALQGAGSGGARMTAKESDAYMNIHVGEVVNIIGGIRGALTGGERNYFDKKVVDAEVKSVAVSAEKGGENGDE